MEAWIIHIKEETVSPDNFFANLNSYSAWSTEKQAYKTVATYLQSAAKEHRGCFVNNAALREAVIALIDSDNIEQAINLVNHFSMAYDRTSKVSIVITKSTFLGNVFE